MKSQHFTPYQKIAALLLSFGQDIAAKILKQMSKDEVTRIAKAMKDLGRVDKSEIEVLVNEFYDVLQSESHHVEGGKRKTIKYLSSTFKGEERESLIKEIEQSSPQLESVHLASANTLSSLIKNEHPQTIAIVVAFCDPVKAGEIIKLLPESIHSEILLRIANLDTVSSEMIEELDQTLKKQIEDHEPGGHAKVGGIEPIVAMLNKQDQQQRESFLQGLEERDKPLADAVRRRLFTFSHLLNLSDKDMQSLLSHINRESLKVALAGESRKLVDKFMHNMSQRAANTLNDDLNNRSKIKKSEVVQAQQKILERVKYLADQGVISLHDDMV